MALTTREEAAKAVEVLVDLQWLQEVKAETGGRPSQKFVVTPRLWEEPHEVA